MEAESFHHQLQKLLRERGWKIPKLAQVTGYSRGYLWELATGKNSKRPSLELVTDLDQALDAAGALIMAWGGADDVNRREALRDLSALALVAPLAGVEAIRQDLAAALDAGRDIDHWEEIITEYAQTFYLTPPDVLLRDLLADIVLVQRQLSVAAERYRPSLCRAAGQLAAITAMTWTSYGQHRQARRWWATARDAADESGDANARVWVRAWEVTHGLYEKRPIPLIIARAHEAIAIGGSPDSGAAGLRSGLAQTLAVAGHPDTIKVLREVVDLTAKVSAGVAADDNSVFGWPEVRLRHTESYVYTALGQTAAAYAAQEAALTLYGPELARERSQMLLHRSRCMITDGDVSGGVDYAHQVLDGLATEQHTDMVYAVARDVLAAVPTADTKLAAVTSLRQRLAMTGQR